MPDLGVDRDTPETALPTCTPWASAGPSCASRFRARRSGKPRRVPNRFLAIYLNDHLAGATVGVELARRAARENAGSALGTFLKETLLPEITADRETLQHLMAQLGVKRSRPKIAIAWAAEKAGRLKLNGEIRRYSPLSRLIELEGLAGGIEGKRALWLALAAADGAPAGFDFLALAERAASQRSRLEPHRLEAAATVL
jgi:hypothetical protein